MPQPSRLLADPHKPLQTHSLHPDRGNRVMPRQELESRPHAQLHCVDTPAVRRDELLLQRATQPNENDARTTIIDSADQRPPA